MTEKKRITEVVGTIVDELAPLTPEERMRAVRASLELLGESALIRGVTDSVNEQHDKTDGVADVPVRARTWMRSNSLSLEQIHQVFHFEGEAVHVNVEISGRSNREKVRNAYVLMGIAHLLSLGEQKFDDKEARELCASLGIYDKTNHMKYMKGGNEFIGSKDKGWTVTSPGLKHGAALVRELSKRQ